MIPPLDHRGLLPKGAHEANWPEIAARFAFNSRREILLAGMMALVQGELSGLANGLRLCLGGSYFSDKPDPGDIDCTIYVPIHEIMERVALLALCNAHGGKGRIWEQYGVELYPSIEMPGANDFGIFFQYVGEKTAALKNLKEKDLRGVIEVKQWTLG